MIKIFLDTEFTGLHQRATLISLALVAETGEEFYAEFTDYDKNQVDPWVTEHVLPLMTREQAPQIVKGMHSEITAAIRQWLQQFPQAKSSLQIWADCYAWDWVLFCELFGGAFGIPGNIHYMPMDLATLFEVRTGRPDTPRFDFVQDEIADKGWVQHHALHDARVEKLCYEKLMRG